MFKKTFLFSLMATIALSACGTFEVSIKQIQTPTGPATDPTKVALEIEATAMRNFLTQQAATLWPLPTPAPTQVVSNSPVLWKTYRNDTHGFTLEYPALYDEAPNINSCGLKENSDGIHFGLRSDLRISDSGGLSLEEHINNLLKGKDWSMEVQKNGTVNGLKAITVEYRFGGTSRYGTLTLVKRDEHIFLFEFTAGGFCDIPGSPVTEPEAYAHMIESFRFDTASATPTPQPPPGQIHPIVVYPPYDSPAGYLLGGTQNGMWLDSGATAALLKGGEQYGIYSDKTFLYTTAGSAPVQNPPFCPAMQSITLAPKPSTASVIAIGGNWNALPRIPQEISTDNQSYRQVIGDLLQANGLVQSDILLSRVLKVDLEGDGTDEVLISASHFSDESGHDVSSGDYSLIVLRKVAGNTAITIPMVTYYYLESQQLAYPNKYTLSAVMDLNGDGRMEILVGITGWEKVGTLGYEVDQSAVRNILDVRCP